MMTQGSLLLSPAPLEEQGWSEGDAKICAGQDLPTSLSPLTPLPQGDRKILPRMTKPGSAPVNISRAFTLIEILISTALLSMIGVFLLVSLNSALQVKDSVEKVSNRHHLARQAISRMVREISRAYLSKHLSKRDKIIETRFWGEEESLIFTAFNNSPRIGDAKISDLAVIKYSLGKDKRTNAPALLRREHPNLAYKIEEGGTTRTLCNNITELQFKYWDNKKHEWNSKWDSTEATVKDRLPERVRISFTYKGEDNIVEKYITETNIWLENPIEIK